jgi:hypothetical protein
VEFRVGCQGLTPVVLHTRETEIRRIRVQSQPRQAVPETLSRKKKKKSQKRADGVPRVAEYLPSKCEALNSNPSVTKINRIYSHFGKKNVGNSSKGYIELSYDPEISLLDETEICHTKNILCSIIHNSQKVEMTQMSVH